MTTANFIAQAMHNHLIDCFFSTLLQVHPTSDIVHSTVKRHGNVETLALTVVSDGSPQSLLERDCALHMPVCRERTLVGCVDVPAEHSELLFAASVNHEGALPAVNLRLPDQAGCALAFLLLVGSELMDHKYHSDPVCDRRH